MSHVGSDPKAAKNGNPARGQFISTSVRSRGFLPERDPLIGFPSHSEFTELDEIGPKPPSRPRISRLRALTGSPAMARPIATANACGSLDASILHFTEDAFTECLQTSKCLCHA